jgi:cytochrome c-type biogenesis protein CcmH/NrfF
VEDMRTVVLALLPVVVVVVGGWFLVKWLMRR